MSNEPNKPIPAQELSEEELAGIVGGGYGGIEIPVIAMDKKANTIKFEIDPPLV